MDPASLASPEWIDITNLLTNLWLVVGLVVFLSTNVMIGHIFIPSLVSSNHISDVAQKARPVFYGLAVASFGVLAYLLTRIISQASVLERIWDRYWI